MKNKANTTETPQESSFGKKRRDSFGRLEDKTSQNGEQRLEQKAYSLGDKLDYSQTPRFNDSMLNRDL